MSDSDEDAEGDELLNLSKLAEEKKPSIIPKPKTLSKPRTSLKKKGGPSLFGCHDDDDDDLGNMFKKKKQVKGSNQKSLW